ncbi:MAG: rhomboid family intramembrane serine protease [Planctomycetota bacterium]
MQNTIKHEMRGVLIFVAVIWTLFLLNLVTPIEFNNWGLTPRTLKGLFGIVTAPFLHGDFGHLISNTIPLVILLTLMAGSRTRTWETVAEVIVAGGVLLWIFGRNGTATLPTIHVGASGLVYGLIAFLMGAGFREKRIIPMLIAVLVGFLYGGTLIAGVIPTSEGNMSWDGHLCGAIAGGALAFFTLGREGSKSKSSD